MRELLLEFSAGPALLRRQATGGISAHEKKIALFILLAKQLQRGFYADFVRDYALLPASSSDPDYWFGAQYYNVTYNDELSDPPLGKLVVRMAFRCACAAEDRNGGADLVQPLGGLDEL